MYDYCNSRWPQLDVPPQQCAWNKPRMKSQHFILHAVLFHFETARGKLAQAPLHPWGQGRGTKDLLLTSWLSLWVNTLVPWSLIQPCEVDIIVKGRAEVPYQSHTQNWCFLLSVTCLGWGFVISVKGAGRAMLEQWPVLQLLPPLPAEHCLHTFPSGYAQCPLAVVLCIEDLVSSWWHYWEVSGS